MNNCINTNTVHKDGINIAASINEGNMNKYFKEVTPEEIEEINELEDN